MRLQKHCNKSVLISDYLYAQSDIDLVTYLRDKLVCVHVQKRDMNLVNKRIQYIRDTGIQHLLKLINTRGTYSVIWQCVPNGYSSHREKTLPSISLAVRMMDLELVASGVVQG